MARKVYHARVDSGEVQPISEEQFDAADFLIDSSCLTAEQHRSNYQIFQDGIKNNLKEVDEWANTVESGVELSAKRQLAEDFKQGVPLLWKEPIALPPDAALPPAGGGGDKRP
jgi:hypothetical protein